MFWKGFLNVFVCFIEYMKRWILLFIVLNLFVVQADTIFLGVGESYTSEGLNVSVSAINRGKAIICVNGEKTIFSDNKVKVIDNVFIEARDINVDKVKLDIECDDCDYLNSGKDLSNQICFGNLVNIDDLGVDDSDFNEDFIDDQIEVIDNENISFQGLMLALLVFVVLVLAIILIWKRL